MLVEQKLAGGTAGHSRAARPPVTRPRPGSPWRRATERRSCPSRSPACGAAPP